MFIAGGATGCGLEIACKLARMGQKVIITGNCHSRLEYAASCHRNIVPVYHDMNGAHLSPFVHKLTADYPGINVFINNTGNDFGSSSAFEANPCPERLAESYFSGIQFTEKLLPRFGVKKEAAVIDLSPLTLSELDNVGSFATISRAIISYYEMLRQLLRNQGNIAVPNILSTGQADISDNSVVAKLVGKLLHDSKISLPDSDSAYFRNHGGPLWSIAGN